ncbi:MAG: hypothetical protein ACRC3H_24610 [Lachnospiraceae bacterium]
MSMDRIKEYAKTLRLHYLFHNAEDEIARCNSLSPDTELFLEDLLRNEVALRSEKSKGARFKTPDSLINSILTI